MGLNISSFVRFLLLAGFWMMCMPGGAFAANCNPGQYYECGEDPYDNSCTECECRSCPAGQTSDGSGGLYYCPSIYPTSPYGDSGCYQVPCAGYNSPCPSYLNSNYRCKELDYGCPSGSGCGVYSVCNIQNGNIVFASYIDGACHIENGDECQPNTVLCSIFPIDHFDVGWNCEQSEQTGNAEWVSAQGAWDTNNCKCSVGNKDIAMADVNCQNANADFYVKEADRYRTSSVKDCVNYSFSRKYCSKCYPGYLPFIEVSPNDGIILRPASNGNWGTYKCQNMVPAPYYADGCDINFSLSSGTDAQNACKKSCPSYMETVENGAKDESDCLPKGSQSYEDGSGSFRLGTNMCQ